MARKKDSGSLPDTHSGASASCVCVCIHMLTCVCAQLCLTLIPQTVACLAPLSMEFSRQEYWRVLPFPSLICFVCIDGNLQETRFSTCPGYCAAKLTGEADGGRYGPAHGCRHLRRPRVAALLSLVTQNVPRNAWAVTLLWGWPGLQGQPLPAGMEA